MLLGKRAVFLIVFCLIVAGFFVVLTSVPKGVSKDSSAYERYSKSGYVNEVSLSWNRMAEKHLGIKIPDFDFASMIAALVIGGIIYGGIDLYIRRKTDDAIKRQFTHIQHK